MAKKAPAKKVPVKRIPIHSEPMDLCRDLGHGWRPRNAWREGKIIVEVLACGRCGAFKSRNYNLQGEVIKVNGFIYAKGYLRPKGSGRMTAADKSALRLKRLG